MISTSANYSGLSNPPLGTIESARDIVQTIALAMKNGYTPDEILDENSPIVERIWAEATATRATPVTAVGGEPEGQARDASVYSVAAPVTPSGAAGEDLIDAERYRLWRHAHCASDSEMTVEPVLFALANAWAENEVDAAIDAARKSGEAKK